MERMWWLGLLALAGMATADEPEAASTSLPRQTEAVLEQASAVQSDRGISAYEPVYFSAGINPGGKGNVTAKFQLSLKYRILNPEDVKEQHWWEQFYFGFTQTSIWDWEAESAPFRDSAYRPALFFERNNLAGFASIDSLLGLRAGLEHESNGKDGTASRSINTVFLRPVLSFPATRHGYVWSMAPKFYAYLEKSDNPDIADYRGYADVAVKLTNPDDWEFTATLRKGMKGHYGSVQVDAAYPVRGWLKNLNGQLHIQYFNGYGETILDYEKRLPSQIRVGLIIVR